MDNELNKGIGGILDPGYKTDEDIAKEKRNRFYKEVIEPTMQGKKPIEPLRTPEVEPLQDHLMDLPLNIDISKAEPVKKKTEFTPKELDNYMADQAKWKEKIRKFRQDPQWVKEHNERFGSISKTTVLPKDPPKGSPKSPISRGSPKWQYEGWANDKVERLSMPQQLKNLDDWAKKKTPVQQKREEYAQKIQDNKNKRSKQWTGGALKMAQEEAEHLNSIKRQTWNNGGRVGPQPNYVTAQDVMNVYEPKGPEATPVQLKGLHQRLKNHNERTGQFKNLPEVPEEEMHPAEQSYLDQLNETIKKGKSITLPLMDPSLKRKKVESENGQTKKRGAPYG